MFPLLRKTNQATFSIFAYAMSGADTSCLGLRNSYDPFYQLCTLWGKINLTGVFSYLKVAGRVPCCAAANSLRALRVTRLRYSHACTTSLACLCCFYHFLSWKSFCSSILLSWYISFLKKNQTSCNQKDVGHTICTQTEGLLACESCVLSSLGTTQHLPRITVKGRGQVQWDGVGGISFGGVLSWAVHSPSSLWVKTAAHMIAHLWPRRWLHLIHMFKSKDSNGEVNKPSCCLPLATAHLCHAFFSAPLLSCWEVDSHPSGKLWVLIARWWSTGEEIWSLQCPGMFFWIDFHQGAERLM